MYLDIYFNALPLPAADGTQKHKPTNALVPTTVAYPGGQLDFEVGMELQVRVILPHRTVFWITVVVCHSLDDYKGCFHKPHRCRLR